MTTGTLYAALRSTFPDEAWPTAVIDTLGRKSAGVSISESADPALVQLYSAVITCQEVLRPAIQQMHDLRNDASDVLADALAACYGRFSDLESSTLDTMELDNDVKEMMARASAPPETAQKKQLNRLLMTTFIPDMDRHFTEISQGFTEASESLKTYGNAHAGAIGEHARQLVDSAQKIAALSAQKAAQIEWNSPVPSAVRS